MLTFIVDYRVFLKTLPYLGSHFYLSFVELTPF